MEEKSSETKDLKSLFEVFIRRKTYRNLTYLLFLFPLGIISFILTVTLIGISGSLMASPFITPFSDFALGSISITSLPMKIILSVGLFCIGVFLLTMSLYLFNAIAYGYKKMLGAFQVEVTEFKKEEKTI